MEEPTTYLGASSRHVFCENYKFQANVALKLFERDEICGDLTWLDINKCSGNLDLNTFKNLPNLEILNINKCDLEKIEDKTFSASKNLKSIDIRKSTFPITKNVFENCENVDSLRFIDLKNEIKTPTIFRDLKKLEYLMFDHILGLDLSKDIFLGLENLKYLFVTKCTIENLSSDAFEHLTNLQMLYFTGNTLKSFSSDAFLKLSSLKILGLRDNASICSEKLQIDYQCFQNLPLLETINFPGEDIKKLNFTGFKCLKNVQVVIGKVSDDVIDFLNKRNIDIECTTDCDYSEEPDFSDPNIQICA